VRTKRPTTRSTASKRRDASGVGRALQYITDILAGDIPACQWVTAACRRHLTDMKRKKFRFVFDPERAERAIAFIESLPHITGAKFAGTPLILSPWQCFITAMVFGWVDRKTRYRRFKTAYIEVPRKNGKSSWSAGVALYCLCGDMEPGAEVYSAATAREQAAIVWKTAKKMVDRTPLLRSSLGAQTGAHAIFVDDTASTFKALSREQQGNLDGLNVHCAVIDELHAHKERAIWDVIETATGARSQPLLWAITTAGFNRLGICYEQQSYVRRILNGGHVDDEYFGIIYTIDAGIKGRKDDDWRDPSSWIKANPNWGVSVDPEDIARKCRKAEAVASAQNNFLTKHLNVWVNADTAWLDMKALERCVDQSLELAAFDKDGCTIAFDLASKIDIAAKMLLFTKQIENEKKSAREKKNVTETHYYAFGRYYLPESAIEDDRNPFYAGWEKDGFLCATPGNVTDFYTIESELQDDAAQFNVEHVAADPWQAMQFLQNAAEAYGVPTLEYRQTVQNMSAPMKELQAAIVDGRFHYDGDPVLTWMLSNVVCHVDAKENIYPRKEFPQNKIDGAIALIMAVGVRSSAPVERPIEGYTVMTV
jgi:phage terminase large subunit-like protein